MEDDKKDYKDFFKPQHDGSDEPENQDSEQIAPKQERPSYYYSYGPYKSAFQENKQAQEDAAARPTSVSGSSGTSSVEVTPPKPLRPFGFNPDSSQAAASKEWDYDRKRRSSSRSVFISFLAGALVVATLMFSADKMNLFTGNQPLISNNSVEASTNNAASSNNGNGANLQNVGLDINRPNNISQIASDAGPAIVKIETLVKSKGGTNNGSGGSFLDDPFFRQFFGDEGGSQNEQQPNGEGELQQVGMGTGFLFEKSGYILTNEHVIEGADEIRVTVEGYDKPFVAKLLGNSYDLDLAALKIEGDKDFPTLPLGNADNINVGDWVVAIGNPYGFDHTVTVGVLSAKERPIDIPDSKGTRKYEHLLQTDASINPGNSGGPLLNLNGEVIGINTAVSVQAQGIGFAIPTSTISKVLDNLKNNVTIPKTPVPYVGVGLQNIDKDWVTELKLENTEGALVGTVERRSPGFKAGLRPYDVIVDINGEKVKSREELIVKIQATKVGDKASLGVIRDGSRIEISVEVGDRNLVATE
ncbi:S1C family serine protease [Paenibacillus eucommiae]|uniref:S1-C subfamily serine protease n=1 Tax=Paenibacillus eucommiae TaxID=1355755 RepID=A0ABS4J0U8_9BACL|nr:trypsin-like peptidase domain-containing protein [Paenibacillus eucommiae]MBP1993462.1 S1-C subfamily serine protease [Paenibacillus eucommiae]